VVQAKGQGDTIAGLFLDPHLGKPDPREGAPVFERNLGLAGSALHALERGQELGNKAEEPVGLAVLRQYRLKAMAGEHLPSASHASPKVGSTGMAVCVQAASDLEVRAFSDLDHDPTPLLLHEHSAQELMAKPAAESACLPVALCGDAGLGPHRICRRHGLQGVVAAQRHAEGHAFVATAWPGGVRREGSRASGPGAAGAAAPAKDTLRISAMMETPVRTHCLHVLMAHMGRSSSGQSASKKREDAFPQSRRDAASVFWSSMLYFFIDG